MGDWLATGTRLVWVIDPLAERAHVRRADGSIGIIASDAMLDGENVLPAFTCLLAEVLDAH